jgi:ribonucleoside-diphosphate reductase alpha chain
MSEIKISLTKNAQIVLERRYLSKDNAGNVIETPEQLFRRVAKNIASANLKYGEKADADEKAFYKLMAKLEFLPNSPTLMNAGKELQQLSACFVLPVEDSMGAIFESVKNAALIHKSGGGTGFSFSRLRPKNDKVLSTGGVASGPLSFIQVFNTATEAVKQGGTRRGANMGILRVDHPDILEFIYVKRDPEKLTNFNLSVGLTKEFMDAVEQNAEYNLVNPRTKTIVKKLNARYVFDMIVECAWSTGEPGIIFLDRINAANPTPSLGEIESTNPCGEQPLLPYESCNLGSINLSKFVYTEDGGAKIDYKRLGEVVKIAVKFLDNVIDMNKYPLPEIERMTKSNRKIGLGVMGFADMLIKLGIPYNSEEALETGREILKFIREKAVEASVALAKKRGTFPNFEKSVYASKKLKLRNATLTTIAPTGTLSIIAGCSSGIEPIYAVSYVRNILDNEKLVEVNPLFEAIAKERNFYSKALVEKVAETGSVQAISEIPEDVRRLFVTALDITPEWHIKMQAAFQEFTDNAVSKTVNLRESATKDDIFKVYMLAYQLGCKGVTVYRDKSRERQVLAVEKKRPKMQEVLTPRARPVITYGMTEKARIGCGTLYITVNSDERGVCEIFAETGRFGGCRSQSEAISRLVSLALRSGISVDAVIDQLKGIKCPAALRNRAPSCPDAIGKAIERFKSASVTPPRLPTPSPPVRTTQVVFDTSQGLTTLDAESICPDCGATLNFTEGCRTCMVCGYTKCWG